MRIFAGFLGEMASNDSGVVDDGNFSAFSVIISPVTLNIRQALLYAVPRRLFSDPQMHNLE